MPTCSCRTTLQPPQIPASCAPSKSPSSAPPSSRIPESERDVLLAHEVDGAGTAELAASRGSTPGAIAAQLNRTRAKLRVEYLLAERGVETAY